MSPRVLGGCAILAFAVVPLAGAPWPKVEMLQPAPLVGVSALEVAYASFAADLARSGPRIQYYVGPDAIPAAVAICGKINATATELSVAWGGYQSWSYFYVQSECFYNVAANGKAWDVCDRVRELDAAPPRFDLSPGRERRLTRAACQEDALQHNVSGGEYGSELMMSLLGYSRRQMTVGGLLPDQGGALELKDALLAGGGPDGQDYSGFEDLLRRTERLPDFSRGDEAGRRALDRLVPGWSSPANPARLAVILRCVLQRGPAGRPSLSNCPGLHPPGLGGDPGK